MDARAVIVFYEPGYEGTQASARAWLEVASVGYLAWRAVA